MIRWHNIFTGKISLRGIICKAVGLRLGGYIYSKKIYHSGLGKDLSVSRDVYLLQITFLL